MGEPIPILGSDGTHRGYVKDNAGQTVVSKLNLELLEKLTDANLDDGSQRVIRFEGDQSSADAVSASFKSLQQSALEMAMRNRYNEQYQYFLVPAFCFCSPKFLFQNESVGQDMHNVNPMRLIAVLGWSILLMGIGPFSCENSAEYGSERTLVQLKTPVAVTKPPAEAQKAGVDSESGVVEDEERVPGQMPPGVAALAETHLDQPEVYLARGFACGIAELVGGEKSVRPCVRISGWAPRLRRIPSRNLKEIVMVRCDRARLEAEFHSRLVVWP